MPPPKMFSVPLTVVSITVPPERVDGFAGGDLIGSNIGDCHGKLLNLFPGSSPRRNDAAVSQAVAGLRYPSP